MDDERAERLLYHTFKHAFNMENYEYFLTELLNISNIKAEDKTNYIRKEYNDYVNKFYDLGSYEDDEGSSIRLCAVELKRAGSRDRARTMQRNLIARYIEGNHDAALIAFYDSETKDWRFSYVKVETIFTDNGIKSKLSSPKRHSFLVGANEPNHTCQKQFLDILKNEDKINIDMIDEAFNIENVTTEFFNEYKRLFLDLTDSLENVKKQDAVVNKEFNEKNIKSSDFAKKLMGQIVFIYFVQKKGWMGIKEDAQWGTGPHDFLRKIFDNSMNEKENFFNDVLEPLFYKGLAEEVTDYHYSEFGYKVPFLNGGLFEPINNYDWRNTDVILSNKVFKEIFDTFDKFNFTIKEDEPLEKEIAVDPEMLGKVFEDLLEVNDRKSKGAFYTPRSIVHYMCQNCLIYYLQSHSNLSEEDVRTFIKNGHLAIDSIIRVNEEKKKYGKQVSEIDLPESIKEHSAELEILLQKVKVIDPAVGSGAFPVGMMNEIVNARYILNLLNDTDFNTYKIKKETIEKSLYGVDKEQSATDITKLRFWLSLIVDEDVTEYIQPLPNLDNHIMCGNSLIDTYHDMKLFDDEIIPHEAQRKLPTNRIEKIFQDIEQFKREYFNTNGPIRKHELKSHINNLKWEFIEEYLKNNNQESLLNEIKKYGHASYKPFFVWELEFSEIFVGENPGFDIVIGNPPYVKENVNKEAFEGLKNLEYYEGKMDLWYFFACKGFDLVKNNGIISFIATNNWITSDGASILRNKVNDEGRIIKYIDFKSYKIFKKQGIQTMIFFMTKNHEEKEYLFDYFYLLNDKISKKKLNGLLNNEIHDNNLIEINKVKYSRDLNKNSYFTFVDEKLIKILDKIENKTNITYLNKNEVFSGIDISQDKLNKKNSEKLNLPKNTGVFVITTEEKNSLNLTKKELKLIKPFYTTKQLKRYYYDENNTEWLIYTKKDINSKINEYPNIKKHLDKFTDIITSDNKPYGLNRPRKEEMFIGKKIIVTRKCRKPTFTYVPFDTFISRTFIIIKTNRFNMEYLVGLLNSELIQFWLEYKGKKQEPNYQLDITPLKNIPLLKTTQLNQDKIIKLVRDITDLNITYKKTNDTNLVNEISKKEKELNEIVYDIYNLSNNEIKVIKKTLLKINCK